MSDTSQAPLISLPLKSTEEVDLGSSVKALIVNSYGEEPSAYAEQTSQLNRARQDAVRGAGSDSTARDLLYKWFHMLEMLELRFPELRVPFPWKDAFTQKTISQSSLAYEKASIIFNIAATLSSLASQQPRLAGNPEGLKRAYAALRQAAGMLSYINENFLHAPSTDMSKDVVKTLVALMLAQASEVFLEKTIEEKKNSGLIAKLASHTASAYAALVEDTKEFVSKGYFERSWSHLVQTKAKHFSSITQYYRALADDAAGTHGSCLVRLTVAEAHAKEAQRLSLGFSSSAPASSSAARPSLPSDAASAMSTLVNTHLVICSERKEAAVKDNDLIYHDILPSESALSAVDKLAAATPISIQDIFAAPEVQRVIGPDLFQRLIPLGVHESASMYSEEKAKIARAESERHDLANGELQAALEYMGLPASLKRYRGIGKGASDASIDSLADPGSEVMRWSDEEAQGGGGRGADGLGTGTDAVASALHRIADLRSQAASSIEAASTALDDENRECEKQRVRYGHRWTQDPAGLHTKEMRATLKENREALQQATANDQRIQELWDSIRDDIDLLVQGRDALEAAFAATISSSGSGGLHGKSQPASSLIDVAEDEEARNDQEVRKVQSKLKQIDDLLLKLHKMKKDRGEVLADLKEKIQGDDISQLLVLNRRSQNVEPAIFASELEKFKAHQNRIAVSLHHQQVVLAEVTQAYNDLSTLPAAKSAGKVWDEKERARSALVARLRRAKEAHAEVRAAVARGLQFYSDLGDIVSALRQNVNRYVADRKSERDRLVGELDWDDKLKKHDGSASAGTGLGAGAGSGSGLGNAAASPPPPPLPRSAASPMDSLHTSFAGMGLGVAPSPSHPASSRSTDPYQRQASYTSPAPPPPPHASSTQPYPSPQYASPSNAAAAPSPYDALSTAGGPFSDTNTYPRPAQAPSQPASHYGYASSTPSPAPPAAYRPPAAPQAHALPPPPPQFQSSFPSAPSSATAQRYGAPPPPPSHHHHHHQQQQQQQQQQYQPPSQATGYPLPMGYAAQQPPPPQHPQHQHQRQYGATHHVPPPSQGPRQYSVPPPPPSQGQSVGYYPHPPPQGQGQGQGQGQYGAPPPLPPQGYAQGQGQQYGGYRPPY